MHILWRWLRSSWMNWIHLSLTCSSCRFDIICGIRCGRRGLIVFHLVWNLGRIIIVLNTMLIFLILENKWRFPLFCNLTLSILWRPRNTIRLLWINFRLAKRSNLWDIFFFVAFGKYMRTYISLICLRMLHSIWNLARTIEVLCIVLILLVFRDKRRP